MMFWMWDIVQARQRLALEQTVEFIEDHLPSTADITY
jgi:hypothetical protein